MTNRETYATIVPKVNNTLSVLRPPVGLPGRIGNRVQIPNGTATVSKEAAAHGESRSLDSSEKAVRQLMICKSG